MRQATLAICVLIVLGAAASAAHAGTITHGYQRIDFGTGPASVPDATGGTNDVVGQVMGYFGGPPAGDTLSLLLPAGHQFTSVTYVFEGKEAGYDNWFQVWDASMNGGAGAWRTVFKNKGTAVGTSYTTFDAAHAFDFRFLADAGTKGLVTNGSNPDGKITNQINFAVAHIHAGNHDPGHAVPFGWYLLLDDNGAGGSSIDPNSDDNHDDMAVRFFVTASPVVPEPSTIALLGLGLAGAAAWRRRKLRQA